MLKTFSKLPDDFFISENKNIQISIGSDNEDRDAINKDNLSALFQLKIFRNLFNNATIFELKHCKIELDDLDDLLRQEKNQLSKIVLEQNTIYYGQNQKNFFDLDLLRNVSNIQINENEFNGIDNDGKVKPDLEVNLDNQLEARVISMLKNEKLSISSDILKNCSNIGQISLEIYSGDESVALEKVEKLVLIGKDSGNEKVPNFRINSHIKELIFEGFALGEKGASRDKEEDKQNEKNKVQAPFSLSALFENSEEKAVLDELVLVAFDDCDIKKNWLLVDCCVNIFDRKKHFIRVNGEIYNFFDIQKQPYKNYGDYILTNGSVMRTEVIDENIELGGGRGKSESQREMVASAKIDEPTSDSVVKFKNIFSNIPEVADISLRKAKNYYYFIQKSAHVMGVSEEQLRASFESYKNNQENGVPYLSDIVDSLKLFGEEFVIHYEKFVPENEVKYRNRIRIIEEIWKSVLDEVLMPLVKVTVKNVRQ